MFDSVCVKPSDWRKLWCKLSKSINHRELVYHDEVFKTMLTETKTMQLFLSPFLTVLVPGTGYRTIERLHQFLNFFPLLGISAVSLSAKQPQKPCSRSPPVYQDLSMCHDWPVKKAIVDLPIRMKRNSKHSSGSLLSLLRAQNKDLGTALQTTLTRVKLHLRCIRSATSFYTCPWSSNCTI